jgi:hypothetical protein
VGVLLPLFLIFTLLTALGVGTRLGGLFAALGIGSGIGLWSTVVVTLLVGVAAFIVLRRPRSVL